MKKIWIILIFIAAIGGLVYYDQVLAIFANMTPLAALKMVTDYLLHVAVVTIVGFVVFGLPEIVKPWMRMLRRKQRAVRRGQVPAPAAPRTPRMNKDDVLMWLARRMAQSEKAPRAVQTPPPADDVQFKL